MQKLVEWVSEPSSDLKIPFHVSCKFVFLCLVKVSCNQTGLEPQGWENAQTKRPRQEEQKRSRKEAFVIFLNWLEAKLCETTLWKSAPLRCFYFKKIEDRNFMKFRLATFLHVSRCLLGLLLLFFCVVSRSFRARSLAQNFVNQCAVWPFFVRGQTCNKKISSC